MVRVKNFRYINMQQQHRDAYKCNCDGRYKDPNCGFYKNKKVNVK